MPVYNAEEHLEEALNSVIDQSFKNWELICVNDGSTDNSLKILRQYESQDNRIAVLDQRQSGTAAAARNAALSQAKGRFLHMLDSDDLLSSDCLQNAYGSAIITGADIVIPDVFFFKHNTGNIIRKIVGYKGNKQLIFSPQDAFCASLTWDIAGVGLFASDLVKKIGFDELGMNGDEYTIRLLILNSNKIVFSEGTYFFRQHPDSTTKIISIKRFETMLTDFRILELAINNRLKDETVQICKRIIVQNICYSLYFLLDKRGAFSKYEYYAALATIRKNFHNVDESFFYYEKNKLQFLLKSFLFKNFLMLYGLTSLRVTASRFKINMAKYFESILHRKYEF